VVKGILDKTIRRKGLDAPMKSEHDKAESKAGNCRGDVFIPSFSGLTGESRATDIFIADWVE
jgi:hypothetical protein